MRQGLIECAFPQEPSLSISSRLNGSRERYSVRGLVVYTTPFDYSGKICSLQLSWRVMSAFNDKLVAGE